LGKQLEKRKFKGVIKWFSGLTAAWLMSISRFVDYPLFLIICTTSLGYQG
jgi:hypothetical protein